MIVIVFFILGARGILGWGELLRVTCAGPSLFQGVTSLVVPLEVVLGDAALLHGEDKGDVFIFFDGVTVISSLIVGRVCNQGSLTFHTFIFIVFADVDMCDFSLAGGRLRLFEKGEGVAPPALEGH